MWVSGCTDGTALYQHGPFAGRKPQHRITPYPVAMITPSKRTPAAKTGRAAGPASGRLSPDSKPFLRFHHSEALRKKTLAVIGVVEQADDPATHRDALADLVVELTNSGLDYYFMKQLKLAKPGFLVEQSANLGMAGTQQVMGTVIRQVIGRMNSPQLLSVCGSIRQLMR
jgi:hypothetical protein